jgi:hypothetical protein
MQRENALLPMSEAVVPAQPELDALRRLLSHCVATILLNGV